MLTTFLETGTGVGDNSTNFEPSGNYITDGGNYFKTVALGVQNWADLVSKWVEFEQWCANNEAYIGVWSLLSFVYIRTKSYIGPASYQASFGCWMVVEATSQDQDHSRHQHQ